MKTVFFESLHYKLIKKKIITALVLIFRFLMNFISQKFEQKIEIVKLTNICI